VQDKQGGGKPADVKPREKAKLLITLRAGEEVPSKNWGKSVSTNDPKTKAGKKRRKTLEKSTNRDPTTTKGKEKKKRGEKKRALSLNASAQGVGGTSRQR